MARRFVFRGSRIHGRGTRVCVDVIIEDPRWESVGLDKLAGQAVSAVLSHLSLTDEAEVAVMGCDDARIAGLNADFRGKPRPTNVLSWPSEERAAERPGAHPPSPHGPELGDIAIAYETCVAEARAGGIPLGHHVLHLVVHGTLHLLGYDHEEDADGDLMESVETAILANLGVPDPYANKPHGPDSDGKD
jgi:probable rRNA maturation factor